MKSKIKTVLKDRWLVAIFVIAVILRLSFLFASYKHYQNDLLQNIALDSYYHVAEYFAQGIDTPASDVAYNTLRTPGYPILLAPFIASNSLWLFLLIQIVTGSIIPLLGYFLSLRLFPENKKLAYGIGIALAIEPLSILLANQLLTETFFTFFFLVIFMKLLDYLEKRTTSAGSLVLLGLLLGYATLIRPIIFYLPLALIALALWKKFAQNLSWKTFFIHIFLVGGIFYLTLLPWLYRNYKTFGFWSLTSIRSGLGVIVWAPSIIALDKNITYAQAQAELFKKITPDGSQPDVDINKTKEYNAILQQTIREHPKGFLLSMLGGVFQFWTHDNYITVAQFLGYLTDYETLKLPTPPLFTMLIHPKFSYLPHLVSYIISPAILIVVSRLLWIVIVILASSGIIKYIFKKRLDAKIFLILLIVVHFSVASATMGIGVTGRVRQPINAVVLIMAGYGITSLLSRVISRRATR